MKLHRQNPSARGSSLIIVLVFAVLLTGLAVVFLTRNEANVRSSRSSANGVGANIFCTGAVNSIIGDLKQEIAAGSTVVSSSITTPATKVYLPVSSAGVRQNVLPYPVNGGCNVLSVVKESLGGAPFYAGSSYDAADFPIPNRASSITTDTLSLNQRSISLARWNKPLFLTATSYAAPINLAPDQSTNFQTPDWIYVSRDGTNPTQYSLPLANASMANTKFVVGRYAYVIYDEASVLDVNVAGYPTPTTPDQLNAKGFSTLADLTQLGLSQSEVDQLVGWRNYASAAPVGTFPAFSFNSATSFFDSVMGATNNPPSLTPGNIPAPNSPGYQNSVWEGYRQYGFLQPANQTVVNGQTDHLFGTRQELIHMLVDNIAQSDADRAQVQKALQYLGTFSRELNQPSWLPVTPAGSALDYAGQALAQATSPSSGGSPANQIAPTVLVVNKFQRDDGTWAQPGDPLMKYRFPLRRLEWFNFANQQKYAAGLLRWFSMKARSDGTWDFVDPDSNQTVTGLPTIKTLDQVAAAGREPTFWEVLQAAILSGSLGDGNYYTWGFASSASIDNYPVRHLLQIGLNIIDQYNSNPTPTVLRLGFAEGGSSITTAYSQTPIAGIKNLPYVYALAQQGFPESTSPGMKSQGAAPGGDIQYSDNFYDYYMQFLMWNPHVNSSTDADGTKLAPQVFQINAEGAAKLQSDSATTPTITFNPVTTTYPPKQPATMQFTATPNRFATIDLLGPSDFAGSLSASSAFLYVPPNESTATQVGLSLGRVDLPRYPTLTPVEQGMPGPDPTTALLLKTSYYGAEGTQLIFTTPMTYWFEVQVPSNAPYGAGGFIPYQVIPQEKFRTASSGLTPSYQILTSFMNSLPTGIQHFETQIVYARSDPRTIRFGAVPSSSPLNNTTGSGSTMPSNNWNLIQANDNSLITIQVPDVSGATIFENPSTGSSKGVFIPAAYAYNTPSSQYYPSSVSSDSQGASLGKMDNVRRIGDGNAALGAANGGSPYFNAASSGTVPAAARPYFLGRSFKSVAEMGYAFRDEPWKTLNFYSADSADAALLDYFSLSEGSIRAGGININTASVPVLTAMLMGAYSDAVDTEPPTASPKSALSAASATAIATQIRNYLETVRTATPVHVAYDPSDLAAISDSVNGITAGAPTNLIPASPTLPGSLKRAEEVIARSLADSWNTRTWNLMIDVMAQTGRFPATTAGSPAALQALNSFVVEGERRLWVHLALDRFTGQIVDLQVEPVEE